MKKKITAIALVVCLLVISVIGATMAYFTDTEEKSNTFTFGKVDITLTEESKASEGVLAGEEVKDDQGKTTGFKYDKVLPGLVYSKKPTVTVTEDSTEAWIVVTVTVPTVYAWDGLFNNSVDSVNFTMDTISDDGDGNTVYIFYAKSAVAAKGTLTPFTQIKINPDLTQSTTTGFDVVVKAYAIQKEGFASSGEAYTKAFTTP